MSASIKILEMDFESFLEMEETTNNLIERLSCFRERHPGFSFSIEKFYDKNKLVVKNLNMNETVN